MGNRGFNERLVAATISQRSDRGPPRPEKGRRTMPEPTPTIEEQANATARTLGRAVLGRDPTDVEATALREIFQATAQALKHGFIRRLADHVLAERETESVEEFFENIKSD
jgi:hypothetical protein